MLSIILKKKEWIESERKFILSCRYYNYEYNEYDDTYELKEAHVISNYEIIYIDENEIQLCNFDGHKGPIKYYRIDGEQWYWYLVDADSYPDGWVYGKYLDIAQ